MFLLKAEEDDSRQVRILKNRFNHAARYSKLQFHLLWIQNLWCMENSL